MDWLQGRFVHKYTLHTLPHSVGGNVISGGGGGSIFRRHCCPPSGDVVVPWRSGGDKIIASESPNIVRADATREEGDGRHGMEREGNELRLRDLQISGEEEGPVLDKYKTPGFSQIVKEMENVASGGKNNRYSQCARGEELEDEKEPQPEEPPSGTSGRRSTIPGRPSEDRPLLLAQLLAALALFGIVTALLIQLPAFRVRSRIGTDGPVPIHQMDPQMAECAKTCRIELVETIPQNVSFYRHPTSTDQPILSSHSLAIPTSSAWMRLIGEAKHSLAIAAYKTSLRGKHVLGEQNRSNFSAHGEMVFDALLRAGLERGVGIRMVENAVAKDKGDNEDGFSLYRRGALARRLLNIQRIYHTGVMHSKFIVADGRHFYLGSANMDWRSLSQKMELGVMVRDCPCLAQDLLSIFEVYWRASDAKTATEMHAQVKKLPPAKFNPQRPLKLMDGEQRLAVHLAASPQAMNCPGRGWDLTGIIDAIKGARKRIFVHVMDYFPMFLYSQNRRYWPQIDNALREAVMRGVHLRIIAAALHFPKTGLRFLKSLETLGEIPRAGSVAVKIFKVPTSADVEQSVVRRDRRTHKKFLLTDESLVIGTSNWSGDYFEGLGTGVAIVVRALGNATSSAKMFEREWDSEYAHSLDLYMERCVEAEVPDELCEGEKDAALLAPRK
uniref:PLD phosphodiesterase domain-containing protein n=1 Tax=Globodera rostochiensis TaxID=31243 RepID=A0A914HY77_GLORO